MKFNLLFFALIIINFACSKNEPLIREIQNLEYSRNLETGIFDRFTASDDAAVRMQVARSVARIQDSVHTSVVQVLAADSDPLVKSQAIFALGQIGSRECRDLLIAFYDQPDYLIYKAEILTAIGRISGEQTVKYLFSIIPEVPDTLKALAIYGITFQTDKESAKEFGKKVALYLNHENAAVRQAAVYFFSRYPYSRVVSDLLDLTMTPGTLSDKYRLKAINRGLSKYLISTWNSLLVDSLRNDLIWQLNDRKIPWQNKVYQLAILADLPDSNTVKTLAKFLDDDNPHLRNQALIGLAEQSDTRVKNILLNYYNTANWQEKGAIINVLAGLDKHLTFRLIQQNLDRGTLYFKQLLLQALARIKDRASIGQLKQFLMVPNPRLNLTAFNELAGLGYITYKNVQPFLDSGDLILATIAAGWVIENPKNGNLGDLKSAYKKFTEPGGIEAMSTILEAMRKINAKESVGFLQEILATVKSKALVDQIRNILQEAGETEITIPVIKEKLFVPDTLLTGTEAIEVLLVTSHGEIVMELYPSLAPVTVSSFIRLVQKGFYDGLTFHRVVSDFVVQGGDPMGTGWGGPGYSLPCEYGTVPFERGTVGMATAGKDTGGSQFFICHSEQPHLNRRYTVFGRVASGMEIVDQIQIDDQITKVQLLN